MSEPRGKDVPAKVLSLARNEVGAALKEAKNELKNTLSDEAVAMLISFDRISFSEEADAVLWKGEEAMTLKSHPDGTGALEILHFLPKRYLTGGALFCEIRYASEDRVVYLVPVTLVTQSEILRLI